MNNNNNRQRIAVPTTDSQHQRAQAWSSPSSSGAGEWPRSSTTEHRTLTLCAERPSNKGSTRQASKPSAITNSNTSATIERGTSPTNRHATRQRGQLPPQHQNQDGGREDRGHVADTRSHDQAGPQGKSPQTCGGRQTTSGTTTRIATLHSATTATHHSSIVHHQGATHSTINRNYLNGRQNKHRQLLISHLLYIFKKRHTHQSIVITSSDVWAITRDSTASAAARAS